ncbi:MAG TPA: hypothetical protein VNC61_07705 [Acidimicrobiales bacterium]|nr:hypothetical protein [Acidimicrobiales bacterium]
MTAPTLRRQGAGALGVVVVTVCLAFVPTACGGGQAAQTRRPQRSTRPSAGASAIGPPSTSSPVAAPWPVRAVTTTGTGQEIAPTSQALYWLDVTGPISEAGRSITPTRYDLQSHRITSAMAVTGMVGSPALTVTGGWAWVVIGQGADVLLEQLDLVTLAVHTERRLPVMDTLMPSDSFPVLTATVGGPLWVAAGEDVWELDPPTGVIETEFDAGNQIDSMSTDRPERFCTRGERTRPGRRHGGERIRRPPWWAPGSLPSTRCHRRGIGGGDERRGVGCPTAPAWQVRPSSYRATT